MDAFFVIIMMIYVIAVAGRFFLVCFGIVLFVHLCLLAGKLMDFNQRRVMLKVSLIKHYPDCEACVVYYGGGVRWYEALSKRVACEITDPDGRQFVCDFTMKGNEYVPGKRYAADPDSPGRKTFRVV